MTTFTSLVANAFGLTIPDDRPLIDLAPGARCAITGAPITRGYAIADIVSDAQGEWWETFGGDPFGYLSESAAACWLASNPKRDMRMSKSLAVFGRVAYEPMISQQSADAQSRPSWRDLARDAWQRHRDEPCAIVLSSDTKKRVWPLAARRGSGLLGTHTPVLIYDTGEIGMHEVRLINWPVMLEDLALVESLYDRGFHHGDVATTLHRNINAASAMGWGETAAADRALTDARRRPHWPFVYLIARGLGRDGARL